MSKYKGLIEDIKEKQAGAAPPAETVPNPSPALLPPASESRKQPTDKRKPGRPKGGKSSNPEFVQATAYVEETVLIAVKKALLDERGADFSSLVNDLLKKWVKSRT
jgi:hypothetical protein